MTVKRKPTPVFRWTATIVPGEAPPKPGDMVALNRDGYLVRHVNTDRTLRFLGYLPPTAKVSEDGRFMLLPSYWPSPTWGQD